MYQNSCIKFFAVSLVLGEQPILFFLFFWCCERISCNGGNNSGSFIVAQKHLQIECCLNATIARLKTLNFCHAHHSYLIGYGCLKASKIHAKLSIVIHIHKTL